MVKKNVSQMEFLSTICLVFPKVWRNLSGDAYILPQDWRREHLTLIGHLSTEVCLVLSHLLLHEGCIKKPVFFPNMKSSNVHLLFIWGPLWWRQKLSDGAHILYLMLIFNIPSPMGFWAQDFNLPRIFLWCEELSPFTFRFPKNYLKFLLSLYFLDFG